MARPMKDGVDYFPFDTDFFADRKIKRIKGEFGAKGILILLTLYCNIYRETGYYLPWDDDDCFLMADAVGCGCSPELIAQVVDRCVERSIFDSGVFNVFDVLTSAGIQRRFLNAMERRSTIPVIEEYWLVDGNDEKVPPGILKKVIFKRLNVAKTRVNVTETPVNVPHNSIKKRKEEKRKEKESRSASVTRTPLAEAMEDFEEYRRKIRAPLTGRAKELLAKELDKLAGNDEALK